MSKVDLRPHLKWALQRISTSLSKGEHYAAAERALHAANSAPQCLHQIQEPATVQAAQYVAADVPAYGAVALSDYLKNCAQHSIVPDVGGAFAFAFAAGFNLATSLATLAAVPVPDEREAFDSAWRSHRANGQEA